MLAALHMLAQACSYLPPFAAVFSKIGITVPSHMFIHAQYKRGHDTSGRRSFKCKRQPSPSPTIARHQHQQPAAGQTSFHFDIMCLAADAWIAVSEALSQSDSQIPFERCLTRTNRKARSSQNVGPKGPFINHSLFKVQCEPS